jgi:hypothetical protein
MIELKKIISELEIKIANLEKEINSQGSVK